MLILNRRQLEEYKLSIIPSPTDWRADRTEGAVSKHANPEEKVLNSRSYQLNNSLELAGRATLPIERGRRIRDGTAFCIIKEKGKLPNGDDFQTHIFT